MKQKNVVLIIAIAMITLIFSCAKDDFQETLGVCPLVIATDPVNGATLVPLDKVITVTFNTPIDPSTINASSFKILGTSDVAGTITYSGVTATFVPSTILTPNTTYVGRVTTAIKDPRGNALQEDYIWTFSTGTTIRPMVASTTPANDEIGVVLNKVVAATFNMPMNPLTITGSSFTLQQGTTSIAGAVTYAGNTAFFTPASNLAPNTLYTATITTAAKNLDGTPIAANYVWKFTTGANVAPKVLSTSPVNNETGVLLNKVVTATFDMAMNPATINNLSFTLRQGTAFIAGTVTYTGTTASFTPTVALLPSTVYTATITTAAQSTTNTPLANNFVWQFTTRASLPPTVLTTSPVNNETGVLLNKIVTANFDMAMDPLTITNATFTLRQGTTPISGAVTYNGLTASFTPSAPFMNNTVYTATITTGAKNLAGISLVANYVWNFTTLAGPSGPNLGSAILFGAFGGAAGITNQGLFTVINGRIGTTAASTLVTGFHDANAIYTETPLNVGNVTNGIFTAPPAPGTAVSFAIAQQALLDANAAYLSISPANMPGGIDPGAGELGGLTLAPGVYKSASGTFKITNGNLTLDAQGNPNALWVFQTASGLTVGIAGPTGARSVIMTNGALPKNVFWYVGSAATINAAGGGIMVGNIISTAGVTFSTADNVTQTVLNGRAISLVASVTMVNTTINVPN